MYYHFAGWCSKRSWNVCVSALHKHGNLFNCNNNDCNNNGHQYDYEPTLYGILFKVKVVHFLPDAIDQYYWLSYYDSYLMGLTTYGKYEIEDQVNFTVYVPKVDEHFVGSLAVIPLQLLGYYVSVAKGLDVDKPRNLAKSVTVE